VQAARPVTIRSPLATIEGVAIISVAMRTRRGADLHQFVLFLAFLVLVIG